MANSLVVIIFLFFSSFVFAQTMTAEVVGEFPYVYSHPDFDASVIANLTPGSKIQISKQVFQYNFHRVQTPKGPGFVSSSEIKIVGNKPPPGATPKKKDPLDDFETALETKKPKLNKPIHVLRYHGLIVETQNFTEDTMSKTRTEPLTFIGYRVLGFNTLFSGEMSTDLSILFHSGAPTYYEKITGNPANGSIFNAHFTFDTIVPLTHNLMASYGFGPMVKYSHFEVNLKNASGVAMDYFILDDMTLGVLFRLGAGVRIGDFSLRADAKYFIESHRYASINLSTLFAF